MYALFGLTFLLGSLYVIYAGIAAYLWQKKSDKIHHTKSLLPLSIVILARNEANNIKQALEAIRSCDYPDDLYEVILMDDHSTDQTIQVARSLNWPQLAILRLEDFDLSDWGHAYKKAGLYYAIQYVRHSYILQMDADCTCLPSWMSEMQAHLHTAKMAIGPIDISDQSRGLLETWQTYESIGTMVSTYVGYQLDLWSSGASANMGYHKDVYDQYIAGHDPQLASGDDIFMIQDAKKRKHKIAYVKSAGALVRTPPVTSLMDLYRQRLRWASKTSSYTSHGLRVFMGAMALFHILLIVAVSYHLISLDTKWSGLVLGAVVFKWLGDMIILWPSAPFFGHVYHILLSPFMSVGHTIYVSLISILATVKKDYVWKGRQVS